MSLSSGDTIELSYKIEIMKIDSNIRKLLYQMSCNFS